MAVNLMEALYLLKELKIETVEVDDLIRVFLQPAEPAPQEPAPALENPPLPPELDETTYKTYAEAKKAAKKGQKPIKEGEGYVLI